MARPSRRRVWTSLSPDPNLLLGLPELETGDATLDPAVPLDPAATLDARARHLGDVLVTHQSESGLWEPRPLSANPSAPYEWLAALADFEGTMLFVSHDLGVIAEVCDRVAVMYAGQIVEQGAPDQVTQQPQSATTRQLLDDIPDIHRDWVSRSAPKSAAAG